jgi:hypothetical protein
MRVEGEDRAGVSRAAATVLRVAHRAHLRDHGERSRGTSRSTRRWCLADAAHHAAPAPVGRISALRENALYAVAQAKRRLLGRQQ